MREKIGVISARAFVIAVTRAVAREWEKATERFAQGEDPAVWSCRGAWEVEGMRFTACLSEIALNSYQGRRINIFDARTLVHVLNSSTEPTLSVPDQPARRLRFGFEDGAIAVFDITAEMNLGSVY